MALRELNDAGLQLWKDWSSKSDNYDEVVCEEKWLTFEPSNIAVNGLSIASLKKWMDDDEDILEFQTRFKVGKISDLFEQRTKKKFLIEGLVKEQSLNVWYGRYGHKKSFAALSAGINVANGSQWLGLNTVQCPVLFVNEDDDTDDLLDRMEAGIKGESLDKNIPFYYLSQCRFNFIANKKDADYLKGIIKQYEIKMVIIDAFDDIMAGFDENAVKDTQSLMLLLRKICTDMKCSMIILHHTNKGGGIRGSTSIPGGADNAIKIESETGSHTIKFSTDKTRQTKPFNRSAIINYTMSKDDPDILENFYLSEGEDTPFDDKNVNDKQKIILDYMKLNNDDLILVEFLKTIPKDDKESYRTAVYALRDKNIIEKNEEKSKHNFTVFTIV